MSRVVSKNKELEKAILVGVVHDNATRTSVEDSLNELEMLADTAGAKVEHRVVQALQKIHVATYIGKGKVQEIKEIVDGNRIDLVIFDDDLSTVQVRNLEKVLKCKLLDRSGLILDIFAANAKTATSKTQVELAQLEYLRTRLTRQWTHLSRQKGGIGFKGPGETQIETDRRLIGTRIATLRKRLVKIDNQRTTQRKGRKGYKRVALVGYTNAGKSTLMNALAEADVWAENRLFATLDATTRQVKVASNKTVLLSDTVGFIRKLPHRLIESFKSTLDEVRESDLLLHVVDMTHHCFRDHIEVVGKTLEELGATDIPVLPVFNKVDALADSGLIDELRLDFEDAVFISAQRGIGLQEVRDQIVSILESSYSQYEILIPITESKTMSYIRQMAEVVSEEYVYAKNGTAHQEPFLAAHLVFKVGDENRHEILSLLQPFKGYAPAELSE